MKKVIFPILSLLLIISCEKYPLDSNSFEPDANLFVNTSLSSQAPLSRAQRPLSELCTKISFALYKDGERLKSISQSAGDNGFGSIAVKILPDTYTLLIVGHSTASNATTTDIQKINFSGKVSDTFVYSEEIEIGEEPLTINAKAVRNVAMFQLNITDDIPKEVTRLKFYYTGGSSSFDATTKAGSVNSRQTEYRDVNPTQKTYEIFTFPHNTGDDKLKITISALDDADNVIAERILSDVSIETGIITQCSLALFDGSEGGNSQQVNITITADDEWKGVIEYIPN